MTPNEGAPAPGTESETARAGQSPNEPLECAEVDALVALFTHRAPTRTGAEDFRQRIGERMLDIKNKRRYEASKKQQRNARALHRKPKPT